MTATADVLVITPHPDDAEFEAGGTIAEMTNAGRQIVYVVCTNGDKGTSDRNLKPEDLAALREKEQQAAARILGVKETIFLRYPDQELEDTREFRKEIVRLIRLYKPELMMTADPYRRYIYHRDHRITGQVCLDAAYPYARDHLAFSDLLAEDLQPHKVKEILFWGAETNNHLSNITDSFYKKIEALQCHESQLGMYPAEHLEEWLKERARQLAAKENYELAEAFYRVIIGH